MLACAKRLTELISVLLRIDSANYIEGTHVYRIHIYSMHIVTIFSMFCNSDYKWCCVNTTSTATQYTIIRNNMLLFTAVTR